MNTVTKRDISITPYLCYKAVRHDEYIIDFVEAANNLDWSQSKGRTHTIPIIDAKAGNSKITYKQKLKKIYKCVLLKSKMTAKS